MTSEGMVAVTFFLFMAIAVELAGGLSLLLGFRARWGALLLAAFLIPVTLIFHDFWPASNPGCRSAVGDLQGSAIQREASGRAERSFARR
jgi:uncharacterized membrane protein YphA (DoxX/SURF4 family)